MVRTLDFSTLIPQRDTFTDADGQVYEFLNATDFGAVEMARVTRYKAALDAGLKALGENHADEQAAFAIETAANDILLLILPKLPRERLGDWTMGQKMAVANFWKESQDGKQAKQTAGEAPAGQLAQL